MAQVLFFNIFSKKDPHLNADEESPKLSNLKSCFCEKVILEILMSNSYKGQEEKKGTKFKI